MQKNCTNCARETTTYDDLYDIWCDESMPQGLMQDNYTTCDLHNAQDILDRLILQFVS